MENAPEIIARKFLNRTNRNLFLTGRAGTGKTTFLRDIVGQTHKKAVIAAPTGVAAINAGGVTLHSLFQLPFGTYIPLDGVAIDSFPFEANTPQTLRRHMQMNATKRRLIQELELLIIDEVSMLRADILDAVDNVLRTVRRMRNVPFGGVQILFIGDLLQLPPVVKDDEWMLLRNYYKSIHFFEALGLQSQAPLYIELEKIYRQSDPLFINVLNHFRDNKVTDEDVRILNQHYHPGFRPKPNEGYIYLTTHNRIADRINREELQKLQTPTFTYNAEIEKDFRDHQFPVDTALELKEGAQVMFIKNDASGYRRFFNGKIGTVLSLSDDEIEVAFNDDSDPVLVEKYTWLNKRYKLDPSDNEIKEEIMGSFTHYPLKLAWAVTVHKSQGLTFEKAIIDVENAFAPGQIYVALSRMTSMDGMILSSPVPTNSFGKDQHIDAFSATKPEPADLDELLETETHKFVRSKLLQYFDFSDLENAFSYHLKSYTKDEKRSVKQRYMPKILEIQAGFKPEKEIAAKFQQQILDITNQPDKGYLTVLHARVKAALDYFEPKISKVSKTIVSLIEELKDAVGVKAYLKELHELEGHFFSRLQLLRKALALIEAVQKNQDLRKDSYSSKEELEAREELAEQSLAKRSRKKKTSATGKDGSDKVSKKKKKGDSARQSFQMFKDGKSILEISKERALAEGTILGHMSSFVKSGEMDILELIDEEKISEIKTAIKKNYKDSIIPVKKALGEGYSYAEINLVLTMGRAAGEKGE